jgi:hypothetical protein
MNSLLALLVALLAAWIGYSLTHGQEPVTTTKSKESPSTLSKVAAAIKRGGEPAMFDEVRLPKSLGFANRMRNMFQFEENTNRDVAVYLLPFIASQVAPGHDLGLKGEMDTGLTYSEILGLEKPTDVMQPRDDKFRAAYTKVINHHIKEHIDDPDPVDGYLYFGNQDYIKVLPLLVQTNPFWASGLTASGDNDEYLELIAYSDKPARDSDAKFLKIMRTMIPNPTRHINVRFNTKDMTLNQVTSYESGKEVIVPEEEWNHYVSGACYNMFYYSNVLHTLIHVYHYYMTAAIGFSTKHDASLAAWANPYDDNIAIKYMEVVATLFNSSLGDNDVKGHTGKHGFGGTPAVMPELRKYLVIWGNCKNEDDFTKKFLLKDLYDTAKNPEKVIKQAKILEELRKHFDNVEPFATELTDAMRAKDGAAFKTAEDTLTKFMSECGEGLSSIDSISAWLQSMSMTGFLHGAALGSSRMIVMPEIMRWRNIKAPTWDQYEISLMQQVTGVLVGMTVGRHVFTAEIDYEDMWETSDISSGVKAVLDKYDAKAEDLKLQYQHELEKRPDMREYGWVLTDHCPDGYDGKQHTQTSYI